MDLVLIGSFLVEIPFGQETVFTTRCRLWAL